MTPLQDQRKHTGKHPLNAQNTEEPDLKKHKTTEESQSSTTRSTTNEDTTENTHLHLAIMHKIKLSRNK